MKSLKKVCATEQDLLIIKNIDILILWIGTNDLQFKYNISLDEIKNGLAKLIELAKNYAERIIIIPPVEFNNTILKGNFNVLFDETCISKSKKAIEIYKKLAQINHCDFFDINEFVKPASIDGLHYDKTGHKIIADKLFDYIKNA